MPFLMPFSQTGQGESFGETKSPTGGILLTREVGTKPLDFERLFSGGGFITHETGRDRLGYGLAGKRTKQIFQ
jgi:hypothetical protein